MSDSESDSSIDTAELQEINASLGETFKEEPAPLSPVKKKKPAVKKPAVKKKHIDTPFPSSDEEEESETPPPPKKIKAKPVYAAETPAVVKKRPRGRPPKPLEEKLARQVITKEKVIYVIQDSEGNMVRKDPQKLGVRELKKMALEEEAQAKELELGRKLGRLKSGKVRMPPTRTAAQKAATQRLVAANKQRAADRRSQGAADVKQAVKESVREVVAEPAIPVREPSPPPSPNIDEQYAAFFG